MYIYTHRSHLQMKSVKVFVVEKSHKSHVNWDNIRLTAASFRGQQSFACPLGQQSIFGWPTGPATGFVAGPLL